MAENASLLADIEGLLPAVFQPFRNLARKTTTSQFLPVAIVPPDWQVSGCKADITLTVITEIYGPARTGIYQANWPFNNGEITGEKPKGPIRMGRWEQTSVSRISA